MGDDIDALTAQLSKVAVEENILSFENKTLQIMSREDAAEICAKIRESADLDGLNLAGKRHFA